MWFEYLLFLNTLYVIKTDTVLAFTSTSHWNTSCNFRFVPARGSRALKLHQAGLCLDFSHAEISPNYICVSFHFRAWALTTVIVKKKKKKQFGNRKDGIFLTILHSNLTQSMKNTHNCPIFQFKQSCCLFESPRHFILPPFWMFTRWLLRVEPIPCAGSLGPPTFKLLRPCG